MSLAGSLRRGGLTPSKRLNLGSLYPSVPEEHLVKVMANRTGYWESGFDVWKSGPERKRIDANIKKVTARHRYGAGGQSGTKLNPYNCGMSPLPVTPRTKLGRLPERGSHDQQVINAILDEGFICHVGFVLDGQPFVVPTGYGRKGGQIYFHGSAASRMLRNLTAGVPVCVTVTLVDALVLARSIFHHSMNYRSVMVLGTATLIEEPEEKLEALRVISDNIIRGRWDEVRQPTEQELKATAAMKLPIQEASAKVRTGPPKDDKEDYDLPIWAGLLPLVTKPAEPLIDSAMRMKMAVPQSVKGYTRYRDTSRETKPVPPASPR